MPYHLCFVAEVVGRRRASSANRCAWSARMRPAAITSEKAGLESVRYAQSGVDAGCKGVTLANLGMLMGPMVLGTGEFKAMEGTYASESSEPHPLDTILYRVAEDHVAKLQSDSDFAAFTSWDDAMQAGGWSDLR